MTYLLIIIIILAAPPSPLPVGLSDGRAVIFLFFPDELPPAAFSLFFQVRITQILFVPFLLRQSPSALQESSSRVSRRVRLGVASESLLIDR
jgi:hypothetical protein